MVKTGTDPRYMAMAVPLRREWRPTSAALKPRKSRPSDETAVRRCARIVGLEMTEVVPFRWNVHTGESLSVPGYSRMRCNMAAHMRTGQRRGVACFVLCDCLVSLVPLLILGEYRHCVSSAEVWVFVRKFPTAKVEPDVAEAQQFGTAPPGTHRTEWQKRRPQQSIVIWLWQGMIRFRE
jgi:hypothetical protein